MRDLAQIQFGQNKPHLRIFLRLFLILVIGGIGAFLFKSFIKNNESGPTIVLKDAPLGLTPVEVDLKTLESAKGVDLVTQSVILKDVKYSGEAKGTATRSFGGGIYRLSVNATLPDPKNTYYQVWLVGKEKVVSVDYMRGAKNNWSLSLTDADKYSSYEGIWVTLERTKDELSEEHVLEGEF